MSIFRRTVIGTVAAMALVVALPAAASACGTKNRITIAEMTWLSAATLAHVAQHVIAAGYGCTVEIVPGDTVPTATSMLEKNEPMIAPEMWLSTVQSIWDKAQEKGNVYKASSIFSEGGREGWWIPKYVQDENPGLKSVSDLKKYVSVFAEPDSPAKGRFYGCPPGWGCEIITDNLFKALDLKQDGFELFSPGSGANLKASIARRVTQKKPIVAYYWGPTDVIAKYHLVRLDMPDYDPKKFVCLTNPTCADPQLTGWKPGDVAVAVVTKLRTEAPDVAEFLSRFQVPNDVITDELAWGDAQSATPDEVAVHFLKAHPEIWTKWVPADVAKRVEASL